MITPLPGWQIDPSNSNGVIPIPGYQPPTPAPAVTGAGSSSTAGNLVKDPSTGAFTLAPGSAMTPVPGSSSLGALGLPSATSGTPQTNAMGTGVTVSSTGNPSLDKILGVPDGSPAPAAGTDPYAEFNKQVASMLTQIQNAQTAGRANLTGAKDTLINTSVSGAGPKPFDPTIGSNSQVQGQTQMQGAFQPAITSINDQINNTGAAVEGLKSTLTGLETAYQPQPLASGSSLVSPDGSVIIAGAKYTPAFNSATGLMDALNVQTGQWASSMPAGSSGIDGSTPSTIPGQLGGSKGVVANVDLNGSLVGMKPYATDPNYVAEVQGTYNSIHSALPFPELTTVGVDNYIKSVAKGSGVTGQMILNASSTYNIDPYLLLAVAQHESDFGTQGVATSTNNPFNVGNTGTSTQNYNSISQGVLGGAAALAKRLVTPDQMAAGAAPGTKGSIAGLGTGMPVPVKDPKTGQYQPTGNPIVDTAQSLIDGNTAWSQVSNGSVKSGGVNKTVVQTAANALSMSEYGKPFSPADNQSAYNYRQTSQYQNYMTSAPLAIQAIATVVKDAQKLGMTPFAALNSPELAFQANFMSWTEAGKTAAEMLSAVALASDDIGKLLGTGQGSDAKIALAQHIFSANGTPIQTAAVGAQTTQFILEKMKTMYAAAGVSVTDPYVQSAMSQLSPYINALGVSNPNTSGGAGGSTGTVTMTGPKGTYTVPASQVSVMQQNGYSLQQ